MSYRACPQCRHKYSVGQYFKKFYFKFIWQSWHCEKCGTLIQFDLKRRLVIVFLLGITYLAIFQLKDSFDNKFLYYSSFILIFLAVSHTLFLFDKFILSDK
jgi:CXXC-20-CXXC protein